jgi:glycosyltransferase involved in cell wall biosynthesis
VSYSADAALDRLHRFNPWFEPVIAASAGERATPPVRVTGYLRDESGWGAAARGYVRALQQAKAPLVLHDVSSLTGNRSHDRTLELTDGSGSAAINLVCVDAGQHFALLSEVGESFFANAYNVGAWAWELPRFPEEWYNRFAFYDEIWVGTSFIASALAPIAPVPVVRIPPVITARGSRDAGRARLGLGAHEFVFGFAFDVHSHLPRKNPAAVIEAFRRAFPTPSGVRLVLKSVNAPADATGYAALKARARGCPIDLYDGYWPSDHVGDFMAACDAYVSLHRSEGTGLTIAEAMALGKPVIATDWSGNTDFADSSNSFPVGYALTTVERNVGPYRAGETWAEPDVDHAAELMREVVADRTRAARRGAAAARRIARDYSEVAIGALVKSRLDAIASRQRLGALRTEVSAFVDGYRHLVDDIRTVVTNVVPPGEIVAVVSRGDSALLPTTERPAWHFPEARPGVYAGYHPADSAEAIDALEAARARGAGFFLLPGTAFWWLDHYAGLSRHLVERYRCAFRDARCIVYDVRERVEGAMA